MPNKSQRKIGSQTNQTMKEVTTRRDRTQGGENQGKQSMANLDRNPEETVRNRPLYMRNCTEKTR